MTLTVDRLQVHDSALQRALTPELFATDAAFALVRQGVAFRVAYRAAPGGPAPAGATGSAGAGGNATGSATGADGPARAGADLRTHAQAALARRTSTGTAGNLDLPASRRRAEAERDRVAREAERTGAALADLVGRPVQVCRTAWLNGQDTGA